jgi:hypothetical protein
MENQNHVWQANLPECLLFHCLEDSGFESIATYKKVIKVRKNKLVKWVNHDNKRKKCTTAERGLFIAGQAQAYGKDETSEMTLNLLYKSQNILAHGTY